MLRLDPYLAFDGNCEEALNHYKECFDGEITSLQRYKDSPMENPKEIDEKILHAQFKADDIFIMAADSMEHMDVVPGNQISLSVALDDTNKQTEIFDKLKVGGKVIMDLQDTFWNARFGMLVDKFGITWMINVNKEAE